jgi:hypothetical protein
MSTTKASDVDRHELQECPRCHGVVFREEGDSQKTALAVYRDAREILKARGERSRRIAELRKAVLCVTCEAAGVRIKEPGKPDGRVAFSHETGEEFGWRPPMVGQWYQPGDRVRLDT